MKKFFIILFVLVTTTVFADDHSTLMEKGNNAYSGKFYQQAIDCYQKIITNGYESAELYYNLGNAYFKQNDMASAIIYFEKAKRLAPGDEDIQFNLNVANAKILDKTDVIPDFFIVRWYKNLYNIFSFNTWALLSIIMLVITLGLATLYLFSPALTIRKIAFWSATGALAFTILFFIFAHAQFADLRNNHEAIIFSPSVTAKSSPDANSTDLFVIHEGTKVKVVDNVGEWSEIKISNGNVGWVNTSVFKTI